MMLALLLGGVVAHGGGLLDQASVQAFVGRYGAVAGRRLSAWERLAANGSGLSERDRVAQVNTFFNQVPWLSDQQHWGRRDYWATPLEMLGTNGGDCEDFAVAKYITLVAMGVETTKLRITYVRALRLREPHMVLAYYPTPDADPLILDNLDAEIRPGSQRADLIPVYSFNATGLWGAAQQQGERRLGAAARIDGWRDVSRRMRREGLDASG